MSNEILTEQEIALLGYIRQGLPPQQAIRMAGMEIQQGIDFLQQDSRGMEAIHFSRELHRSAPIITRDLITSQLYEERARAATATEGVACLREIAKINGLYDNKVVVVKGGEEEETEGTKSLKQIQRMSDDDLIRGLDETGLTIDLLPEEIRRD